MAVALHSPRSTGATWHTSIPGRRYTVVVSGVPAGEKGWWVGLFLAAAADNANIAWVYLTGDQVLPGENVPAGWIVKLEFVIPVTAAAGTYNFRFFSTAPTSTKLATSLNFSVVALGT